MTRNFSKKIFQSIIRDPFICLSEKLRAQMHQTQVFVILMMILDRDRGYNNRDRFGHDGHASDHGGEPAQARLPRSGRAAADA